jgi:hypothetical protein
MCPGWVGGEWVGEMNDEKKKEEEKVEGGGLGCS